MREKCVDASFVPFCDLAFQVGRGLVPHQPCFGVLTAVTRKSTRSPRLCPPPADKAEENESSDALLYVVRQNASVGGEPRTDGLAILLTLLLFGAKKTRKKSERNIEHAICRTVHALPWNPLTCRLCSKLFNTFSERCLI